MSIRKRRSEWSGRAPLPSPGRPPVAGRDEQSRFWQAIAVGLSSEDAALEAGISQPVGTRWFRKAGDMPPAIFRPSAKPLSGRYLSLVEREEIALLRVRGDSMQEIGRRLSRAASTISRELRRNAATRSGGLEYRATTAQWHAERSTRRPKPTKLALNTTLRTYAEERLVGVVLAPSGVLVLGPAVPWKGRRHGPRKDRRWARAWSSEQIARRLPIDFPDDKTMRISHEAIYQALFVQGRGALRRELTTCLRTGRVLRVPRARGRRRSRGFVSPAIMITQRPAEAADRAVPGHWEGDLILGLGSSAIGTLVERTNRHVLLWSSTAAFSLALAVQIGFITHHVAMAEPFLGTTGAGMLVSATGLVSLLGRLYLVRIVDSVSVRRQACQAMAAQTVAMLAIGLWPSTATLIGGSLLYGYAIGHVTTLSPVVVRREFGAEAFGATYGTAAMAIQFMTSIGPLLMGSLRDLFGGYPSALLVASVITGAGCAFLYAGGAPILAGNRPR